MPANKKLIPLLLTAVLLLSACNLPSAKKTPQAVYTEAALTVQAEMTQKALFIPSATPMPPLETLTPVPPSPTTPPTAVPSATPLCDLAQYVTDVTIPDGTQVLPGQSFTKTWRLKNIGVCAWNSSYQLIFESGALMDGPSPQPLAGSVGAGQTVDISVTLKSPATPGSYRGYWRLRNPAGVLVPVAGGHLGMSFFVDIQVVPPTSTPTVTSTVTVTPTVTLTVTPTP